MQNVCINPYFDISSKTQICQKCHLRHSVLFCFVLFCFVFCLIVFLVLVFYYVPLFIKCILLYRWCNLIQAICLCCISPIFRFVLYICFLLFFMMEINLNLNLNLTLLHSTDDLFLQKTKAFLFAMIHNLPWYIL